MIRRLIAAFVLCVGLAACKENGGAPVAAQLFQGAGEVKVLEARVVPSGDSSAQISAGTISYVMVRVELTNDFGIDLTPQIDHFYFIDRAGNRFQAKDSGSAVFTLVSNSQQVLKQNDKREYVIGFRTTDPSTTGTITYER